MITTAGTAIWAATNDDFVLGPDGAQISGLRYTDRATVLAAAALAEDARPNLFTVPTQQMRAGLLALPAVADADVHVVLPNRLEMSLVERAPVLALRRRDGNFVVDADGVVLASPGDEELAALGLPTIEDDRLVLATDVHVGGSLDSLDLAAMLQLGAVTPALLESSASTLGLTIDDADGYVMTAAPYGWRAIFGNYTPTLRPPDLIPRQVQCLRSLLAQDEAALATIYLAPLDERCGTYLPRISPSPQPSS